MNRKHAELAGIFEIERPIINKNAFLRSPLGYFQGDAEDGLLWLASVQVTRTEEELEVATQIEFGDAELVQFKRLVVDRADEVFVFSSEGVEHGARFGVLPGLREHAGGELFASEGALTIENSAIEILV